MKKVVMYLLFIFVIILAGCSSPTEGSSSNALADKEEPSTQVEWGSILSNISGNDIEEIAWPFGSKENPSVETVVEILHYAAEHQLPPTTKFGNTLWTLWIYTDSKNGDKLNPNNLIILEAGIESPVVRVSGGTNLPENEAFFSDEGLYNLLRTIMDSPDDIDEVARNEYLDDINCYIEDEARRIDSSLNIELSTFKRLVDRADIDTYVYTIGTVMTTEPAENITNYIAGGGYIDSRLRLHPDGDATMSNMLVINKIPVGYVSWDCLEATNYFKYFKSNQEILDSIKGTQQWYLPMAHAK